MDNFLSDGDDDGNDSDMGVDDEDVDGADSAKLTKSSARVGITSIDPPTSPP